jgi:hypothetical protein
VKGLYRLWLGGHDLESESALAKIRGGGRVDGHVGDFDGHGFYGIWRR